MKTQLNAVMKELRRLMPGGPEVLINVAYANGWTDEKLRQEGLKQIRRLKAKERRNGSV